MGSDPVAPALGLKELWRKTHRQIDFLPLEAMFRFYATKGGTSRSRLLPTERAFFFRRK
jgi:hypothetical protein